MAAKKKKAKATAKKVTSPRRKSVHTGRCECGAVQFTVKSELGDAVWCHCSKCRRFHGGPGAYTSAPRGTLSFQQRDGLAWWDASRTVQRGFCKVCGASLFFSDSNEATISVVVGALDTPTHLRSKAHIFVGSKPDWYEITDGLKQLDTY